MTFFDFAIFRQTLTTHNFTTSQLHLSPLRVCNVPAGLPSLFRFITVSYMAPNFPFGFCVLSLSSQ
jgi:hypothetical protein